MAKKPPQKFAVVFLAFDFGLKAEGRAARSLAKHFFEFLDVDVTEGSGLF